MDKGWTCDLVPKHLIVARYFAAEQEAITKLEAELESIPAQMTEMEEEHGGEEGAFSELDKVKHEGQKETSRGLKYERLKEIKGDKEAKDEAKVLNDWLKLNNQDPTLKPSQRIRCALDDSPTHNTLGSPRPRSRRWSWRTNEWPLLMPPSTARWTVSARLSPSA